MLPLDDTLDGRGHPLPVPRPALLDLRIAAGALRTADDTVEAVLKQVGRDLHRAAGDLLRLMRHLIQGRR
jgi:hypothetical protein